MTPSAVLFDLDGTLVDTALDFFSVVNELRDADGLPPLPDRKIRDQVSNGGVALACLTWNITRDHPDIQTYRQRLLDHYEYKVGENAVLFSGFDAVLQTLRSLGIPWGIVTNKPRLYTDLLLERMPLHADYVICPEDVIKSKPAPDSLLLCAEKMQVPPDQCWYVGDHIRDIEAAHAAGMKSFAANFGYIADDEDPTDWKADAYLSNPAELLQHLGQ
ncbi:HAD family hydrolase [Thalassolituus maritimus]|uniref:N-acetylmuramic acid 6-phosphate phosphatase MupP n=1 Tax=Thalassolituus maritimus TaxID=484498 RepID=A0ABQ0A000_9GAMM